MTRRAAVLLVGTAALLACSPHREGNVPVNQRPIDQVFADHRDSLMAIPGVVGVAIVQCGSARCIRVMVAQKTPELERRLPKELEGYGVEVRETGPIRIRGS